MPLTVTSTCANGHEHTLTMEGMSRKDAERFAGLLDGSSPLYVYPPGDASPIGKCGVCGARFKTAVSGQPGVLSDPDAVRRAVEQGFSGDDPSWKAKASGND